jgi:hypothetical protein
MSKKPPKDDTGVDHIDKSENRRMWPKESTVTKEHDGDPDRSAPIEDYGGWYSGRNGRP